MVGAAASAEDQGMETQHQVQHHPVPPGAVKLGALVVGSAAGAGIALGLGHQPTTANIHSGYAFAGLFEALVLFVGGGLLGAGAGFLLGWSATRRRCVRGVVAALAVLGVAGVVGWSAMLARPTIDCDDSSYCGSRY